MLTVAQFVNHLDLDAQGAVLYSKEAFLEFLREQFTGLSESCAQVRRDLYSAAKARLQGQRIRVDAMPDEREAAKAVLYVVMKLGDRLKARAHGQDAMSAWHGANQVAASRASDVVSQQARRVLKPKSLKIYKDAKQKLEAHKPERRWQAGYNGAGGWATANDLYPRFPMVMTVIANGRETVRFACTEQLEKTLEEVKHGIGHSRRYVAAIAGAVQRGEQLGWQVSHPNAKRLAKAMVLQAQCLAKRPVNINVAAMLDELPTLEPPKAISMPMVEVHPEKLEVGETLHFNASGRETGYARVTIDGEEVDRVRCWCTSEFERLPSPERDCIRGGTIKRIEKPKGTRALTLGEMRLIELEQAIFRMPEAQQEKSSLSVMLEAQPTVELPTRKDSARLYGQGTSHGEIWLYGTADDEVMRLYLRRLLARA
jgi:hypothetical protein